MKEKKKKMNEKKNEIGVRPTCNPSYYAKGTGRSYVNMINIKKIINNENINYNNKYNNKVCLT
jgi:hypothetical protein